MDYPDSRTNIYICNTPFPTSTALGNHQQSCSTVLASQESATSSLDRLRERQKRKEEKKATNAQMAGQAGEASEGGPAGMIGHLKNVSWAARRLAERIAAKGHLSQLRGHPERVIVHFHATLACGVD